MDWFEKLMGFAETTYPETRSRMRVQGNKLVSLKNGAEYRTGVLELVSLGELRARVNAITPRTGALRVSLVRADVGALHRLPENSGALFQVASQFNLLEMICPSVTPEQGVTQYQEDGTQGPACAIAAGAATIFRNYFVPVAGSYGQTATRQLDGLADLGAFLSRSMGVPVSDLWTMKNGYALPGRTGPRSVSEFISGLGLSETDELRARLRIGLHRDVEVTDTDSRPFHTVSQAFCSALPVAYSEVPISDWEDFAILILEAAYEATLLAGALNAERGASNVIFLTFLGGGAFGNCRSWILRALSRSLDMASKFDLDVRLVVLGEPKEDLAELINKSSKQEIL